MTTLLLSRVFPPQIGGSGRWFWEIYRRLSGDEYLVAAGEHEDQQVFDRTHDLRLVRVPLALRSWGFVGPRAFVAYVSLAMRLWRLARRERIQTIHAGCCLPEGFLALLIHRLTGRPYIVYVHGEELNVVRSSRELTWMTTRVFGGAEYLIANSRNTARILQQSWPVLPAQIRIVHPGVDIDRFVPAGRDASARRRLGWENRRVVLTVARLQKRKGHDQLIRALSDIKRAVPDVLYAIVGDGEERSTLEQLASECGVQDAVQFRGEPDDAELVSCYQQCDLFVLPNRDVAGDVEGFGMVLLEAQACGRPVVAGDSGGTAETMRVPETGVITSCDDPKNLAHVVVELLRDETRCEAMGIEARRWVTSHFGWDELARKADLIFRSGQEPLISAHQRNR